MVNQETKPAAATPQMGVAAEADAEAGTATERQPSGWQAIPVIWLAAISAFALFLGLASVTTQAGRGRDREIEIVRAWTFLAGDLPASGHGTLLRVAFYGAVTLFLIGSSVGLWLALTAGAPAGDPMDAAPRVPPSEST